MKKVNSKIAKKIIRLLNNNSPFSKGEFDEKSTVEIGKLVNDKGDIMYEIQIYGGNVEGYMMINDKETVLKINEIYDRQKRYNRKR